MERKPAGFADQSQKRVAKKPMGSEGGEQSPSKRPGRKLSEYGKQLAEKQKVFCLDALMMIAHLQLPLVFLLRVFEFDPQIPPVFFPYLPYHTNKSTANF